MNYASLEHIRKEFGISVSEPDAIRRELIRRLKKIHPDLHSGPRALAEPSQEEVLRITAALRFMDESKRETAVVPAEDVTSLVRTIRDLAPLAKDRQSELRLTHQIQAAIQNAKTVGRNLRIMLAAGAGLLTMLWLFPSLSRSHPVLRDYIHVDSPVFTMIWLAFLTYTGLVWYVFRLWIGRETEARRRLALESTQNSLFERFMASKAQYHNDARTIGFYKDELVQHIAGAGARGSKMSALLRGRPRPLDLDLAQTIAEIVLARALRRGIVRRDRPLSLRDHFTLLVPPGNP